MKQPGLEPVITDCYKFFPDPDPEVSDDLESPDESRDEDFIKSKPLQTFNQEELNDLVRDLALSKAASELLASRLHQKNFLCTLMSFHIIVIENMSSYHILLNVKIVSPVVTLRAC